MPSPKVFTVDTDGTLLIDLVSFFQMEDNSFDEFGENTGADSGMTYAAGKINNAAVFDGSGHIDLGTDTSLNISDVVSVSAWVKPAAGAMTGFPMILCHGSVNTSYLLFMGSAYPIFRTKTGPDNAVTSSQILTQDTYHHVVGTCDGTTIRIWVDGVDRGSNTVGGFGNSTLKTVIGRTGGASQTNPWYGQIDEVGVWNKVLSNQEIADLYNSGSGNPLVDADWYDLNWLYRSGFNVKRASGALTDYQIPVTVRESEGVEDLTGWTEVDTTASLSADADTLTVSSQSRMDEEYFYKDFGAGYFTDFTYLWEAQTDAAGAVNSVFNPVGWSNSVDDQANWANGIYHRFYYSTTPLYTFTLGEIGGASVAMAYTPSTQYYMKTVRKGSLITTYVYSDAARETLVGTLQIHTATTAYRYMYAYAAYHDDVNTSMSGTVANISGAPGLCCWGNANADLSDLRFTDEAGVLQDYWIESISGTTPDQIATVWVEFKNVGVAATLYFLYYGNSGASDASSGADTFIVFDDFERGVATDELGAPWTEEVGVVEIDTAQAFGGTRSAKLDGGVGGAYTSAYIPVTMTDEIAIRFRYYKNGPFTSWLQAGDGSNKLSISMNNDHNVLVYDGSGYVDTGLDWAEDTWEEIELRDFVWGTPTMKVMLGGSVSAAMDISWASSQYVDNFDFYGSNVSGNDVWADNLLVRNYRTVEPAIFVYSFEQEAGDGPPGGGLVVPVMMNQYRQRWN